MCDNFIDCRYVADERYIIIGKFLEDFKFFQLVSLKLKNNLKLWMYFSIIQITINNKPFGFIYNCHSNWRQQIQCSEWITSKQILCSRSQFLTMIDHVTFLVRIWRHESSRKDQHTVHKMLSQILVQNIADSPFPSQYLVLNCSTRKSGAPYQSLYILRNTLWKIYARN